VPSGLFLHISHILHLGSNLEMPGIEALGIVTEV